MRSASERRLVQHTRPARIATIWNRVYLQARDEGHAVLDAVDAANWYCRQLTPA